MESLTSVQYRLYGSEQVINSNGCRLVDDTLKRGILSVRYRRAPTQARTGTKRFHEFVQLQYIFSVEKLVVTLLCRPQQKNIFDSEKDRQLLFTCADFYINTQ